MQRFAVVVSTPNSIPDVPSMRRELETREREHTEQKPSSSSSDDPSRIEPSRDDPLTTEHDRKRKRDHAEEQVTRDKDGDIEMSPDDGLLNVTVETFEPHYIEHDERILQEPYTEPKTLSPILQEPKLDEKRAGGLDEGVVSKAMKAEMESFRKFEVYDEVDIDDLTPDEQNTSLAEDGF